MLNPLVSVIIPTFNRSTSLIRALESVLKQTYSNYEIIVVDDASTDDTVKMVQENYNEIVELILQPINMGGAFCRNMGVNRSKGSLVCFLDSDDCWFPDKLEKQVELWLLLDEDARHSYFGYTSVVVKVPNRVDRVSPVCGIDGKNLSEYLFCDENIVQTSSYILSRSLALKFPFRPLRKHQDWDLLFRLENAGVQFNFIDKPLVEWIQDQPQRVSTNFNIEFSIGWYKEMVKLRKEEICFYRLAIFPFLIRKNPFVVIKELNHYADNKLIALHYIVYILRLLWGVFWRSIKKAVCLSGKKPKNT